MSLATEWAKATFLSSLGARITRLFGRKKKT